MITNEDINRINELSRKSKGEGLNEQEKEEQATLRRFYIDSIKQNIAANMENVRILETDGSITKVKKKQK